MSTKFEQWLQYPGSFVERLKAHGVLDPKIEVLQEGWEVPQQEERVKLNIQELALIREVLIVSKNVQWMYARSVFTKEIIAEKTQLGGLKNQSLGSVLFNDPAVKRAPFEFLTLRPGTWLYDKAHPYSDGELKARSSIFTLNEKSLLLTEVFFPTIESL